MFANRTRQVRSCWGFEAEADALLSLELKFGLSEYTNSLSWSAIRDKSRKAGIMHVNWHVIQSARKWLPSWSAGLPLRRLTQQTALTRTFRLRLVRKEVRRSW